VARRVRTVAGVVRVGAMISVIHRVRTVAAVVRLGAMISVIYVVRTAAGVVRVGAMISVIYRVGTSTNLPIAMLGVGFRAMPSMLAMFFIPVRIVQVV
jgi:hypothetical protein